MLKRFIAYYRPHRKMFILDMLASLLISVIGMIYPIFSRTMLNDLIPNHRLRLLVIYGLTLLALYAVRMLLRYFVQFYGHMVGVGMQAQMRSDMFNKLETLPYSFYDEHETGKIMSRMTNDLMDVSELAHHGPENLLISGIMIVGSFVYLCTISVPLTLIIFACVPVMAAVSLFCRKRMRDAFAESRKSIAVINAALESSISGIRVTKAFTNADKEAEKFEKGNAQFVEARKKAYRAMAQFFSSTSFITDVFNVVVMLAGGLFMYAGKINFGDYSAFIVSVNQFIGPVTTLINFMEQYQNGVTGFERFLEIMDEQPEQESPNARDLQNVQGEITLDHVSFSYDNSKEVLKDVSLNIKKGETLALVGPSGGGKTTICHLIPAFYKATGGRILIDGTDINDVTFKSLRRSIGIVQQDVFLFAGSILENIRYGKPGASMEEVVEAAKLAEIHEDIMRMPDGYDTIVGERGIMLSGGQKQRVSIARIFLKNPRILILDEATSALDTATERRIQAAFDRLAKGRTTLVIAHRLSTIRNADEIVVIGDHGILEQGTHAQLIEQGGIYAELAAGARLAGEIK